MKIKADHFRGSKLDQNLAQFVYENVKKKTTPQIHPTSEETGQIFRRQKHQSEKVTGVTTSPPQCNVTNVTFLV